PPPHAPLAQAPRPAPPDAVKILHVRIRYVEFYHLLL
ncbi:hypothetical protein A2U01_0115951, partial [Trifolium medium]|nr:hypothetical protein [Trifolium medium]